jgi:hypothetical protein
MNIRLHIEHLVLDPGLCAPEDRQRLRVVLQAELGRLLSQQALLASASGRHLDRLDVPPAVLPRGDVLTLASGIAAALHQGLLHV